MGDRRWKMEDGGGMVNVERAEGDVKGAERGGDVGQHWGE
jgi:hypothetical protein